MIPLFKHQEDGVRFLMERGGVGALYVDMGCGKTRMVIEAFSRLKQENPFLKMVVICPLSLIEGAWTPDIRKFSEFTCYNAHDNGLPAVIKQDVLLINYEAVIQAKNKGLKQLILNNLLVLDESSRLKSPNTQTTKMILSFKDAAKHKIIMSGTPAPNSPMEYWAQIEFLQAGLLGVSNSQFRNNYFYLSRGNQVIMEQGQVNPGFVVQMLNQKRVTHAEANLMLKGIITRGIASKIFSVGAEYAISPANLAKLMETIKPLVFWAKKEDCLDLPEQVDEVRMVELTSAQARHYKEMARDLITEIKNCAVTAPVALTKIMKLREITSGFAIDVNGNEVDIEPGTPVKIRELEDTLEDAGCGQGHICPQVIIWACFKWDIRRIVAFLEKKYGEGCAVTLYSGTHDHQASIGNFKAGMSRFMVANPASAAHGLNLQFCHLQVFFSLDYSWERYIQGKGRIHRSGQTEKCTYVHLIARDTIDEEVLKCLQEKGDINRVTYGLIK